MNSRIPKRFASITCCTVAIAWLSASQAAVTLISYNTFGTTADTATSLSGYGNVADGVLGSGTPLRYFSGASQAGGSYDLAVKGSPQDGSFEKITSIVPTATPPPIGSALWEGGTFDGTAMWLTHSMFKTGSAPALNSDSPASTGTAWNNATVSADTGVSSRPASPYFIQVPVTDGVSFSNPYKLTADIYVPSHAGLPNFVFIGPYADRQAAGVAGTIGGHFLTGFTLAPGSWHQVEIDANVTTFGNGAGTADDTWNYSFTMMVDGVAQPGSTLTATGAALPNLSGAINLGLGFGMSRSVQGTAAEAFVDNIETFDLIPEPSTLMLLAAGLGLLWRRSVGRQS